MYRGHKLLEVARHVMVSLVLVINLFRLNSIDPHGVNFIFLMKDLERQTYIPNPDIMIP